MDKGLRSSEPQGQQSNPKGASLKFGQNRGRVAVFSRKPTISLTLVKRGPKVIVDD